MDDFLIETLGRDNAPTFDPLIKTLDRGLRLFEGLDPATTAAAADAAATVEAPAATGATPGRTPAPAGPGISGAIRSADDVRQTLGKICDYYEANEPSSPVPFLLRRAQRLIGKNFLDLIDNLTPNARSEFNVLMGPPPES